jgi:hypothetical protein
LDEDVMRGVLDITDFTRALFASVHADVHVHAHVLEEPPRLKTYLIPPAPMERSPR